MNAWQCWTLQGHARTISMILCIASVPKREYERWQHSDWRREDDAVRDRGLLGVFGLGNNAAACFESRSPEWVSAQLGSRESCKPPGSWTNDRPSIKTMAFPKVLMSWRITGAFPWDQPRLLDMHIGLEIRPIFKAPAPCPTAAELDNSRKPAAGPTT